MRAFEIHINRERACLAGIGDDGVLPAIVSWTSKDPPTDLLEVGGLNGLTRRHVDWGTFVLNAGDEVTIKVVDVDSAVVDEPPNPGSSGMHID